jgi:hypothetical protein
MMMNAVSFWRAMKLISQMQREDRDPDGSDGCAGLASAESDAPVALRTRAGEGRP